MNPVRTWLILIASVAIVCDAKFFPFRVPDFFRAISPYDFNVTTDGSFAEPAAASVTLFVKPKGGSFGRRKREALSDVESSEGKQSLEERDGKVLFSPARWDFSPTSGAAVTVGATSALASLIWTVIHETKKAREANITSATIASLQQQASSFGNQFGSQYSSQYAPSPYYPSYESYYPTPSKAKPPKIFKGIDPIKGLKAIQDGALKGITKLQSELKKAKPMMPKPQKSKKHKQKPTYYPYYPPAMSPVPYYPPAPAPSYPEPSYPAPAPSYSQPSYPAPAPSYSQPSYPAPAPSYPQPSYPAPAPSYPEPSYPAPAPSYSQPSYPAPAPSYPQPSYPAPAPSYPQPSYPSPAPSYPQPSYPAPAPSYPHEPVYPREEVPTYGVPPTPAPYAPPPPTEDQYAPPPPTEASYVPPPPTEAPYEPPQVPAYVPPPTQPPTTTPVYRPPAHTQVPIQYESFIPIAPSPPKTRQLLPPPDIEKPVMNAPLLVAPGDFSIVPSPIDPTPFDPSDEEAAGLWGRPSQEVMSWLSPEFGASNTNEPVPSNAGTMEDSTEVDDTTPTSTLVVTPETIFQADSNATTPSPPQGKL